MCAASHFSAVGQCGPAGRWFSAQVLQWSQRHWVATRSHSNHRGVNGAADSSNLRVAYQRVEDCTSGRTEASVSASLLACPVSTRPEGTSHPSR